MADFARAAEATASFEVLGIPISVTTLDSASDIICTWAQDDVGRYIGVREVASVMAMYDDPALVEVANRASMNLPDGMPMVWIGKKLGLPVQRTCGPDLMDKMLRESGRTGMKHFLYGGKEGVADNLADRFRREVPGIRIVGTYCPPFRALTREEDADIVRRIRDSEADIVWVGISSPKQDIWAVEHLDRIPATMIGVGAAFDFHSGEVSRAPRWMQKAGLEWLYRLLSEPRRLWKRYLVLAPQFVLNILRNPPKKVEP